MLKRPEVGTLYPELILHRNLFYTKIFLGKKRLINFLYCVYPKFIPCHTNKKETVPPGDNKRTKTFLRERKKTKLNSAPKNYDKHIIK